MTDADTDPAEDQDHVIYRFWTETGSAYEYDPICLQVRRVHGRHAPTERQGQDGVWKRLALGLEPLTPAVPVTMIWSLGANGAPATVTSPLARFEAWWGCGRTVDS